MLISSFKSAFTGLLDSAAFLAQISSPSELKARLATGLGVMFLFGFIWGVIMIWQAAGKRDADPSEAKAGILKGLIIAGSAAIMSVLFFIFGLGAGAINPTF